MDMKTPQVGGLIDKLHDAREKKRKIAETLKAAEETYSQLEEQVKQALAAQGLNKASGKKATASAKEMVVAQIEDFDAFAKYVGRTKQFHLFERRVSNAAYREIRATGKTVPGLNDFKKTTLSLTTLK